MTDIDDAKDQGGSELVGTKGQVWRGGKMKVDNVLSMFNIVTINSFTMLDQHEELVSDRKGVLEKCIRAAAV